MSQSSDFWEKSEILAGSQIPDFWEKSEILAAGWRVVDRARSLFFILT